MNYDEIAQLYDKYVFTDFDYDFFLRETKDVCGKVLELTSGTGRLSIPLIKAGVDLTCVDSSQRMLDILQQKLTEENLKACIVKMDICDLDLDEQYQFIIIPFNSFSEIISHEKQIEALKRIKSHLTDDGVFICTLHNPAVRLKQIDGNLKLRGKFNLENGYLKFLTQEMYDSQANIVSGFQYYEQYDKDDNLILNKTERMQFYLHTKEDFESCIKEAGFKVEALYGDYSKASFDSQKSPFIIWILKK